MPDFNAGSDQPVVPDGIELDPFEMDWPWPGVRAQGPDEQHPPQSPIGGAPAAPTPFLP